MNREIKFRAWDKNKGFLKGYSAVECLEQTHNGTSDSVFLMQYTGLLDNNGKEIYEGDILRIQTNSVETLPLFFVNWFESDVPNMGHAHGFLLPNNLKVWEIIGNIYENPNLIK